MAAPVRVAIIGATGRTGASVTDGLLASETKFEITAFSRHASINSAANDALKSRGVRVVAADLRGPKQDLVKLLTNIDIVISCIVWTGLDDQVPLAEAAKEAGVKRFIPCDFSTTAPRGVMLLRDKKEDVLAAIQRLYLPYTVIDVGWWTAQAVPALPSGRTDSPVTNILNIVPGDGAKPLAYTDVLDIGTYVAKIIVDPRTLNKKVYAYTEILTPNQITELIEELSGEKAIRKYLSAEEIHKAIKAANEKLRTDPEDESAKLSLALNQYVDSWGLRGDGSPESAAYLGYLDFKQLYPDVRGKTARTVFQEILDGKRKGI
ncbi:isoflavone reductase family protein [Durotheca rogersii]|uniref:isoflavone reductase family protein n=1 Tax=Durotheca rogersii TaxID=419775 RepID=UPI00221EB1D9|nr:isoflavone reductase family protein [Durotheca rogersii]KAI5862074.1 isoflavone reductase family protein [Durotheca rogersii]